ncbi:MAG: zinc-dependent metalloprotease [Arcanobacterium sp.]|nr:zinc-dependent metalloprotease [Arcanobacterium sp.]
MSEHNTPPHGFGMPDDPNDENWQEMLRAVFSDAAAGDIADALKAQGIDPHGNLGGVLSGKNFTLITQQIQDMLGSSGNGPVNWKIAEQVARETVTSKYMDRLSSHDGENARSALRTASLWLDVATDFNPASGPSMAWPRLDFVAHALPTFRKLLEPVGANIARAFHDSFTSQLESLPDQMRGMFGDPAQFIGKITGTMIGVQYGSALAELAAHSFGSSDAGLPLMEGSNCALVPSNIEQFAEGLSTEQSEVLLYVATRENAASRLYSCVPWLRSRILDTVSAFASHIAIDTEAIEDQLRSSLQSQQPITQLDLSSIFTLELTEQQQELLARLELLLSLVEGWVAHVSSSAVAAHLPHAVALREMFSRRYATDNPAKAVWEAQLGMRLEPRSMREAIAFWEQASAKLGIEKRDALWAHPDFLPTAEALKDPGTFFAAKEPSAIEAELDSFLEDLFSHADGERSSGAQSDNEHADGEQRAAAQEADEKAAGASTAGELGGNQTSENEAGENTPNTSTDDQPNSGDTGEPQAPLA